MAKGYTPKQEQNKEKLVYIRPQELSKKEIAFISEMIEDMTKRYYKLINVSRSKLG